MLAKDVDNEPSIHSNVRPILDKEFEEKLLKSVGIKKKTLMIHRMVDVLSKIVAITSLIELIQRHYNNFIILITASFIILCLGFALNIFVSLKIAKDKK